MCVPWTASVSDGTSTHTAEQKPAQTTSTAEDTHSSRGSAAIVGSEEQLPAAPSSSQALAGKRCGLLSPPRPRCNRMPLEERAQGGWVDAAERSRILGWRFPRGVGPRARRQHHGQGRGSSQQQVAASPSGFPGSLPWLEKRLEKRLCPALPSPGGGPGSRQACAGPPFLPAPGQELGGLGCAPPNAALYGVRGAGSAPPPSCPGRGAWLETLASLIRPPK